MKKYIGYVVTVVVTLVVSVSTTYIILANKNTEVIEKTVSEVAISESDTIKTSIAKVYDSAVVIESYYNDNLVGSGSGFVYKKDDKYGYILTNNHVIESAGSIKVIDNEGKEIDAELLGKDVYMDIAVLRIDVNQVISVANIGSSEGLEIGDTVFAIGAPVGRKYIGTVTKGIVSGTNREVTVNLSNGAYIMEVLQTDTAVNPGNSGGPLVNINGDVVGITSMKLVQDEIEGMAFAIPIEEVMSYVDKLEQGEEIQRPILGVRIVGVNQPFQLSMLGINVDKNIKSGVVIYSVESDTIAAKAGLKDGDVITKINDEEITDVAHFRFLLHKHSIGDSITLTYIRDGKENTVTTKL